jgi:hypothetical protein
MLISAKIVKSYEYTSKISTSVYVRAKVFPYVGSTHLTGLKILMCLYMSSHVTILLMRKQKCHDVFQILFQRRCKTLRLITKIILQQTKAIKRRKIFQSLLHSLHTKCPRLWSLSTF